MKITKPLITPKQLEILTLLYRYRFLNRIQIQHFLQHKNDTRITAWLRDLTKKEYLGRIYSFKIGENIKPAIYYLATKSRGVLKTQDFTSIVGLKHIYRESARSLIFQQHCIFMGDVYFYFQAMAKRLGNTFTFFPKTDLLPYEAFIKPFPDAYIVLQEPKKRTIRYFLEVFDEGMPRFAIKARIKQYCEYRENEEWETATGHPFPKILLICSSERTQKFLTRFIIKILEDMILSNVVFFVGVQSEIQQHQSVSSEMWERVAS